jgi:hypothetical protein
MLNVRMRNDATAVNDDGRLEIQGLNRTLILVRPVFSGTEILVA